MLSRILRRCIPTSIQILKIPTARNVAEPIRVPTAYNGAVTNILDGNSRRIYSQQTAAEAMTATYEEVDKATGNKNVLIVDVREPDEVKEHGKIPNSINIPLGSITNVLSTMSDKDFQRAFNRAKPDENTEIIFYCMIGKRSGKAQQNAINLGFKKTKNYLGSWTDWASKK